MARTDDLWLAKREADAGRDAAVDGNRKVSERHLRIAEVYAQVAAASSLAYIAGLLDALWRPDGEPDPNLPDMRPAK